MSANIIMCSVHRNKINLFTKEKVKHPENSYLPIRYMTVIKTLVISCHHSGRDTPTFLLKLKGLFNTVLIKTCYYVPVLTNNDNHIFHLEGRI